MKRLMSSFRTLLLILFIPFLVISCGEEEKSDNEPTVSNSTDQQEDSNSSDDQNNDPDSSVQACQTGLNVDHKVSIRNDRLQTIAVAVDGDFNNILVAIDSGETCEIDKTGLSGELVLLKVADYADASDDPDNAEILTSRLFLRAPKGGSDDQWTILSGFGYAFLENLDDRILNIRKDSRLGESFGFINSNSEQQLDLPKGRPLTLLVFPLTNEGELLSEPTNILTNLIPDSSLANAQAGKRLIGVASVDFALTNNSDDNVAVKLATETEFLLNNNNGTKIIQPNHEGSVTVQFPSNEDGFGLVDRQIVQAFIGSRVEIDPSLFSFSTSVSLTYEKNTTYSAIFDGSTINLPTSNSDDPVKEKSDNKPTVSNSTDQNNDPDDQNNDPDSSVQTCQTGLNVDHKVSIRNDRLQTIAVAVDGDFNDTLVAIDSGETCEIDKTRLSGELVTLKVADYADASADPDNAAILTSRLFLRAPRGGSDDQWTILSDFGYAFLENIDDRIMNIRKDSLEGESFGFINSNSEQQLDLPKGSPLTLVAFPLTSDGELLSTPTNVMTNLLPNSNVANAQANKRLIGVASVDLALTNYSDHNVAIKLATESEFLINENTDNEIIQPNNVGNLTVQFPSNEDGLGSIGSQTIQAFIGSQGQFDPSLFSFSTSLSLAFEKNTTYTTDFLGSSFVKGQAQYIKLAANGDYLSNQECCLVRQWHRECGHQMVVR